MTSVDHQAFAKVDRERARLEQEEDKTREEMQVLFAKMTRLGKQQKFLSQREAKMVQLGLENVEELERVEKEEEEAKAREQAEFPNVSSSSVAVGSSDFGEALSPGSWERLLAEPVFLETGEGEPGSS